MDILIQHMGKGIGLVLFLSLPAVLLAAGIGLVVGILQAVTQVQEQTIAAAPKITFVFLLVLFGGPLMMNMLEEYLIESVRIGMEVIPHESLNLLPPKHYFMSYADAKAKKDTFFKEDSQHFAPNKAKQMMEASPSGSFTKFKDHPGINNRTKVHPKTSVAEKVYLRRRANGTLPKPPQKNQ